MTVTTKEALLAWRKAAGLSQVAAAELIGRSRLTYIHYEQGKAKIPAEVSAKVGAAAVVAPQDPWITRKTHPKLYNAKFGTKLKEHPAYGFGDNKPRDVLQFAHPRDIAEYGPLVEWVEGWDSGFDCPTEKPVARVSSLEPENYKRHQEWLMEKTRGQAERDAAIRARMPAELQRLWDDVDD
jgi:transcriptional regulator with XRE-family HTH domain